MEEGGPRLKKSKEDIRKKRPRENKQLSERELKVKKW